MQKITILAIITIGISTYAAQAQEKVQTESGFKSDFIYNNGRIGIGTATPVAKNEASAPVTSFHVKKTNQTGNVEIARFEGGSDADNTAAVVRINHSNDRGLYIKGGRRLGDTSFAEFGIINTNGGLKAPSIAFNNSGNVGVGTINPVATSEPSSEETTLHVKKGSQTGSVEVARFEGGTDADNTAAVVRVNHSNDRGLYIKGGRRIGNTSFAELGIINTDGGLKAPSIAFNNSGNVGIGTTNPVAKNEVSSAETTLHVKNTEQIGDVEIARFEGGTDADNTAAVVRINHSNDRGLYIKGGRRLGDASFAEFGVIKTNGELNAPSITIDNSGNVGIGTDNPKNFKLGVLGKIAAEEVKVATYTNWWPDYVFDKAYDLPTLKEVENYINEKGHLKDIPSAKKVAKNGFYLGEMDSKLLKKIEELTLYTIEQDKKIQYLEQQTLKIKQLEKENKLLKLLYEKVSQLEKEIKK